MCTHGMYRQTGMKTKQQKTNKFTTDGYTDSLTHSLTHSPQIVDY